MAIKKVSISLAEGLYNALSQWAEREGNKPTSLATDIVANAIREEIKAGRLSYGESSIEK